jgi:RNA polymerase sigma-70 factor (ECF subfamily)
MSAPPFPAGSTSTHLLEGLRGKDQKTWETLVALYEPVLFRRLARFSFSHDERQEVAQNFWLAVYQGIEGFRKIEPDQSLRRWLATVAQNKAIDFFRARARRPVPPVGGSDHLDLLGALPADSGVTQTPEENEERKLLLQQALERVRAQVTEHCWNQFQETAIRGAPVSQVARERGVTAAAVRMNNSRVKRMLRELLGALWE